MDKTVVLGNNNEPDVPGGIGANNAGPEPFLRKGHLLKNRYEILSVLGHGGFGLTYACIDRTLDLKVAVKEYYPDGFVSRDCRRSSTVTYSTTPESAEFVKKGLHRFIDEARVLAKFSGELGIVDVRDYFEENNTAYIVMEFLDGKDLKQLISEQGKLPVDHAVKLLLPVMESLEKVHRHGLIHRDISPDNIRMVGKRVKLLDFGAARDFSYEGNKTMTVLLKRGYAPIEQYGAVDNQGPWTDVYALCATLYLCITGRKPADALVRWENDPLQKPSQLGVSISPEVENVIMKGLSVSSKDRYQSMKELAEALAKAFNVTTTVSPASAKVVAPASAPVRPQMPNSAVPARPQQPVQKKNPAPSQPSKPTQSSQPDKDKPKNKKKLIIAVIAAVLVLVVAGVVGYIGWSNAWFDFGSGGYVDDTYYEDETTDNGTHPSGDSEQNIVPVEKPIRELEYDVDGNLTSEIEYNPNGDRIRLIPYYEEGTYRYEYKYDDSGNVIEIKEIFDDGDGIGDSDDIVTEIIKYEYDAENRLEKKMWCYDSEYIRESEEYEYNDAGILVGKMSYHHGDVVACHKYVYNDTDDLLITEEVYDGEESDLTSYFEYGYDDEGRLLYKEGFDKDGCAIYQEEYIYEGSRLIKVNKNDGGYIEYQYE